MENILKKRISRKKFLKSCGILFIGSLIGLKSLEFFKKDESKNSYGNGKYGG